MKMRKWDSFRPSEFATLAQKHYDATITAIQELVLIVINLVILSRMNFLVEMIPYYLNSRQKLLPW